MNPIRIGFDMDGVVADFATAYRGVEQRLFGGGTSSRPDEPEREEESPSHELRRRRDVIWKDIQATVDFWATLEPLEKDAVGRIHRLMLRHHWEVFFLTQRPATAGETVQRQSQRWLVKQGFDLPSVLVISGSRGAAAAALRLSYHVDDNPQHCIDVRSESTARPLLIVPDDDPITVNSARKMGIGVASSLSACLDILEEASAVPSQPGLLERLAALVGWR
jgi:uncharacterized protein